MVGPSGGIPVFGAARLTRASAAGNSLLSGIPAELDPESHAESARRGQKFELPCALARHP
jgi:hypothetical protein